MTNITIVFTRHQDLGKCNSVELYRIFEEINPNVIFEEMPQSSFEERYVYKSYQNLENVAIDKYTRVHKIPHIGVDIEEIPPERFFSEYRRLYEKVERLNTNEGYSLRNSMDLNTINAEIKGFEYLNSEKCHELYNNVNCAINNAVKELNDEKLNQILQSWNDIINRREHHMLTNIYSYCRENDVSQAVFTIGAAHGKSLLKKVDEYKKYENILLNWNYYTKDAST
jgi:hypothetical protein